MSGVVAPRRDAATGNLGASDGIDNKKSLGGKKRDRTSLIHNLWTKDGRAPPERRFTLGGVLRDGLLKILGGNSNNLEKHISAQQDR